METIYLHFIPSGTQLKAVVPKSCKHLGNFVISLLNMLNLT